MGTAKRERKKANRAAKIEREIRRDRVSAVKRKGLRWGGLIGGGIALVVVIAAIGGAFSSDDTPAADDAAVTTTTEAITTDCPPADGSAEKQQTFDGPPADCLTPGATYTAEIVTNKGTVVVELDAEKAPLTVNNFVTLARYHYFDDTECHRIIPGFMAQCGDPTASGSGGPGYRFADELPEAGEYQIGSVAMANRGPDTNGSQFFIITGQQGVNLPPNYTLFGQVIEGLDDTLPALDAAGNPESNGVPPLEQVTIESVTITEA
ncbi:MAG: peptidylprolyl isomerase [Actinomycetota bacterium]|nr:peptidylprolyl isomerase [Actinomycetota bacterium]